MSRRSGQQHKKKPEKRSNTRGNSDNHAGDQHPEAISHKASVGNNAPANTNSHPKEEVDYWLSQVRLVVIARKNLFVTIFAFIAAGLAAAFTGFQVWIARDAEHRQLRAYVSVDEIGIKCPDCAGVDVRDAFVKNPDIIKNNVIYLNVVNNGETPAYSIKTKFEITVSQGWNADIPSEYKFAEGSDVHARSLSVLAKGTGSGFFTQFSDIKPLFAIQQNFKGDKTFSTFIYGSVGYCDIFKIPHKITYCFRYRPDLDMQFPYCERHNAEIEDTADQKCE